MSAAAASEYDLIEIQKDDREPIAIADKVQKFDYFESVYSPTVTATIGHLDTGNSVHNKKTGLLGTLKDALPVTGFEKVSFVISNPSGKLNFKTTNAPLAVTGSPGTVESGNRQATVLPLVSQHEIDNSKTPVKDYYRGRIDETVSNLLTKVGIPESHQFVESTQNNEQVNGRSRSPFEIILSLCKKSIPISGDPGFFFYQTQDGFHFKSIDALIEEGSTRLRTDKNYRDTHTYTYFPGALNEGPDENDFKILTAPQVVKDQNVLDSLKNGSYLVRFVTANPITYEYKEEVENLLTKKNLGSRQESVFNFNTQESYFRTFSDILDVGSSEPGVSKVELNNPMRWEAQSNMRYNLLHAQLTNIQVPCNLNLRAGEVIRCEIENITASDKVMGIYNEHRSGNYIILHLCHHFDPTNSYTSLTLARDTYGLYTNAYS